MPTIRRDVGIILQRFRDFLLGREHTLALRFMDDISKRTQPPPQIPGGPYHNLSENYYYKRDIRYQVKPPINISKHPTGKKDIGKLKKPVKLPTPGTLHWWD